MVTIYKYIYINKPYTIRHYNTPYIKICYNIYIYILIYIYIYIRIYIFFLIYIYIYVYNADHSSTSGTISQSKHLQLQLRRWTLWHLQHPFHLEGGEVAPWISEWDEIGTLVIVTYCYLLLLGGDIWVEGVYNVSNL